MRVATTDRMLWAAIFNIAFNQMPTTLALNGFFQGHLQPLVLLKLIGYEDTFYNTTPSEGGLMSLFSIDKKTKRKLYSNGPSVSLKKAQLNKKGNIADDSPLVSHMKEKNFKRKLVEDNLLVP